MRKISRTSSVLRTKARYLPSGENAGELSPRIPGAGQVTGETSNVSSESRRICEAASSVGLSQKARNFPSGDQSSASTLRRDLLVYKRRSDPPNAAVTKTPRDFSFSSYRKKAI